MRISLRRGAKICEASCLKWFLSDTITASSVVKLVDADLTHCTDVYRGVETYAEGSPIIASTVTLTGRAISGIPWRLVVFASGLNSPEGPV